MSPCQLTPMLHMSSPPQRTNSSCLSTSSHSSPPMSQTCLVILTPSTPHSHLLCPCSTKYTSVSSNYTHINPRAQQDPHHHPLQFHDGHATLAPVSPGHTCYEIFPCCMACLADHCATEANYSNYTVTKAYHPITLYNMMGKVISAIVTDILVYL